MLCATLNPSHSVMCFALLCASASEYIRDVLLFDPHSHLESNQIVACEYVVFQEIIFDLMFLFPIHWFCQIFLFVRFDSTDHSIKLR